MTRLGISTFLTIRLFDNMTVLDNVLVGMNCRLTGLVVWCHCAPPWVRHEERRARQRAQELLDYVGLLDRAEDSRRICRMGSNGCSKLPGPWQRSQGSYCWMNHQQA